MSKTCGNWFNIDKKETRKIWVLFLLASHLFRHSGARSAQAPPPPPLSLSLSLSLFPPEGNKLSGGPAHESYSVTAGVWRRRRWGGGGGR